MLKIELRIFQDIGSSWWTAEIYHDGKLLAGAGGIDLTRLISHLQCSLGQAILATMREDRGPKKIEHTVDMKAEMSEAEKQVRLEGHGKLLDRQ